MNEPVEDAVVQVAEHVAFPRVLVDPKIMELEKSLETLQAKYESLQINQQKLGEQNAAILADIKCPVCFNSFASKRVNMCENGHNVCVDCNAGLDFCPVGRCTLGTSRNLFVEMASSKVQRPCKFAEEGCYTVFSLLTIEDRELHESSCPHRFQCKFFLADNEADEIAYCQWLGKRADYLAHCNATHPTAVINANEAVLCLPIPAASARTDIEITVPFLCHEDKLFLLVFHYRKDAETRVLVPVPMFLGNRGDLEKFRIAFTFFSNGKKNVVVFVSFPREPIREDFATILRENSHLDKSMLNVFAKRNTIDCAVKITLV